jgi:hypothetical protein
MALVIEVNDASPLPGGQAVPATSTTPNLYQELGFGFARIPLSLAQP